MDAPLVIRPKLWLFLGAIAALVFVPVALSFVPNPFEALSPGGRPARFLIFLWVALPLMALVAAWRLLTWTTYRATHEELEARSMLGARRRGWTELTSAHLDTPIGMPPAYELRFGKHKVRFIAAHHDRKTIQALKALAALAPHHSLPPSARSAA
jgi:hypothetical protein